ncbi:sce7726 family protein [Lysobacter sp. TAF61]|uniref:sce7726 family protein n=1 Tax=Lysobacter sp. TAF61 TaxID=3233072 RepID=UPI003F955387
METADDAKIRLLSILVPQLGPDEAIGSELRFGDGRYRADLAIASTDRLAAIEIKGPRDDIRKLEAQLSGYLEMFLEVSIATTRDLLPGVRAIAPRSVGLIDITSATPQILRTPKARKLLTKAAAAYWFRTFELRNILQSKGIRSHDATLTELRAMTVGSLSVDEINQLALASVYERLRTRHTAFVEELGHTPTLDDLRILTLPDLILATNEWPGGKHGN